MNRPGGSTRIGSEAVARYAADGHTLPVVFPSFVINPALRQTIYGNTTEVAPSVKSGKPRRLSSR